MLLNGDFREELSSGGMQTCIHTYMCWNNYFRELFGLLVFTEHRLFNLYCSAYVKCETSVKIQMIRGGNNAVVMFNSFFHTLGFAFEMLVIVRRCIMFTCRNGFLLYLIDKLKNCDHSVHWLFVFVFFFFFVFQTLNEATSECLLVSRLLRNFLLRLWYKSAKLCHNVVETFSKYVGS